MLATKHRIKGKEINGVKKKGKLYRNKLFGVIVLKTSEKKDTRFGFVISKKVSKLATERNRIKRALYESLRHNIKYIKKGTDMVFLVKPEISKKSTNEIMREAELFLRKYKFIK